MPHHATTHLTGEVTDIFAHRFVLKTDDGKSLADLGPAGARAVDLKIGDTVEIEGEQHPSEIKVAKLTRAGRDFTIPRPGPKHDELNPALAIQAVTEAGYAVLGPPRRKPKHFEVLGRQGARLQEFHVEADGHIRKAKPVTADDEKWKRELTA